MKDIVDLTGKKFSMLFVLNRVEDRITSSGKRQIMWKCLCDCGNTCLASSDALKSGHRKSCGCYQNTQKIRTKIALKRSGSFAEKHPYLKDEWNLERNDLSPEEVPCGSDYKAWWICPKCNNEYQMRVSHRINNHACPFCSNPPKKIKTGYNDLVTYCKEKQLKYIIDEWDYEKNSLNPENVFPMSNQVVYWKCPFGHSYQAQICRRTGRNLQCPICNREGKTSFAEQAIGYYLSKFYSNIENGNHSAVNMELDIFIPQISTAIEYDGHDWHSNTEEKEHRKNALCIEKQIRLIRIREGNLPVYNDCICIVRRDYSKDDSLNDVIKKIISILGLPEINVDVNKDRMNIYEQYVFLRKKNSVASVFPEIAKEWHPSKNGELTPEAFSAWSNKKVWWLCSKGHEYASTVSHRSRAGSGCPVCKNRKIELGINDLQSYCKQHGIEKILDDWDWDKNNQYGIDINKVFPGSIERVWWKCSQCGYEWQNSVNNRIKKLHMCPNCRKNKMPNSKRILNIDTGEVYNSISEAARSVNVCAPNVSACCRGKGKTAGGYHWKYLE